MGMDMDNRVVDAHAFIERWQGVTASELATAQSFVMDLCEVLGVSKRHPTRAHSRPRKAARRSSWWSMSAP